MKVYVWVSLVFIKSKMIKYLAKLAMKHAILIGIMNWNSNTLPSNKFIY
jgi:hypothetical protein